jgi:hypothetical protein
MKREETVTCEFCGAKITRTICAGVEVEDICDACTEERDAAFSESDEDLEF